MYKTYKKGDLSWDDLSRVIYGVPDYAGNLSKMNNDTSSDIVIIPDNELGDVSNNGICCCIGDNTYTDFQKAFTIDKLGCARGAVFVFTFESEKHKFKKYQKASVYDENGLFLKGAVADVYPVLNEQGRYCQLEIRSDAGVLIESNVPHPLDFAYLSLKAVIQRICDYYSIKVVFDDDIRLDYVDVTDVGNSYAAELNEKAWDFICRIASARGFIVNDTVDGLFVGKIKESETKMSFIEGETVGVNSWKPEIKTHSLCRYYEAHSQYPKSSVAHAVIPVEYPTIKRMIKEDASGGSLQDYINWFACREIGGAYKYKLDVSDNLDVYAGDFVNIQSESCMLYEPIKMIVEEKIGNYPLGNVLTLTLPCAYTGIIPEGLP